MRVTLLHVRDPDSACYTQVFVDGVEVDAGEYTVDAGRGYSREDWDDNREADLQAAALDGPAVVAAVEEAYADPPGGKYIT